MNQGQQQQGDNSLDFLWMSAILVVSIFAIWYFGHTYITLGVFYTKLGESYLINWTILGADNLLQMFGVKQFFGPVLSEWIEYIRTTPADEVSFQELVVLSNAVGVYLRYPVALILLGFAFWVFTQHVNLRFNFVFDMKRLRATEAGNWPQITPVVNQDLVDIDIEEGPWAMAKTPVQFGKKHDLLNYYTLEGKPRVSAHKGMAHRVFATQLGPLWRGPEKLPIHARALFAAFAAKANRDDKGSKALIHHIAKSYTSTGSRLDYTGTDEMLNKYANTKLVKRAVRQHAYVLTVMASMLDLARTDGVMACADFLWLKTVDRRLWFVLNSVGRQTAVPEAAGPFSHWNAEIAFGRPLKTPMVDQAVNAYIEALDGILYDPNED